MFLLYVFAFSVVLCGPKAVCDVFPSKDDATDGLECLLRYLGRTRKEINLDGVFGVRMAEGELRSLLSSSSSLSVGDRDHLSSMAESADSIVTDALPSLADDDGEYFKKFEPVLKEPWMIRRRSRRLDTSLSKSAEAQRTREAAKGGGDQEDDNGDFNEEESDKCMIGLMGTGSLKEKCGVSDKCWKFMVTQAASGYHVTHQLLFLSLGLRMGCGGVFEQMLKVNGPRLTLEDLEREKCSAVYGEMVYVDKSGMVERDETIKDLFMESAAICGPLGFYQVLRPKWLGMALIWQNGSGCFGAETADGGEEDEEEEVIEIQRRRRRRLLMDKTLSDGCSSHESGVAAGFLSVFVRYFFTEPHLLAENARLVDHGWHLPDELVTEVRNKLRHCSGHRRESLLKMEGFENFRRFFWFIGLLGVLVLIFLLWRSRRWRRLLRRRGIVRLV